MRLIYVLDLPPLPHSYEVFRTSWEGIIQHDLKGRFHPYYGWYSNRSRGMRKQLEESDNTDIKIIDEPADPAFSRAAKASWARLIQKVYEVDPMLCPRCGAEMRLMALIDMRGRTNPTPV